MDLIGDTVSLKTTPNWAGFSWLLSKETCVGVYIPIIRIPIKGGRSPIPKKTRLLTMAHIVDYQHYPSELTFQLHHSSGSKTDAAEIFWKFLTKKQLRKNPSAPCMEYLPI